MNLKAPDDPAEAKRINQQRMLDLSLANFGLAVLCMVVIASSNGTLPHWPALAQLADLAVGVSVMTLLFGLAFMYSHFELKYSSKTHPPWVE